MDNSFTGNARDLKYSTVFGIQRTGILDYDNTQFTDYICKNYTDLLRYCQNQNIDKSKAPDLLNDVWQAYKKREMNGDGFDMTKGHASVIFLEEAVKANIKKTALNDIYYRNTCSSKEVLAHFTSDTDEDQLQDAYTNMAAVEDIETALIEDDMDLAENISYFISITSNCRVSGLSVLEKLDQLISYAEQGIFKASLLSDLWRAGDGVAECFISIVECFGRSKAVYKRTLNSVKGEMEKCKNAGVAI